jgi:hypothetical protein
MIGQAFSQRKTSEIQSASSGQAGKLATQTGTTSHSLAAPSLGARLRPLPKLPSGPVQNNAPIKVSVERRASPAEPELVTIDQLAPEEQAQLREYFNQAVLDGLQAEFGPADVGAATRPFQAGAAQQADQSGALEQAFAELIGSISTAASEAVAAAVTDSTDQVVERILQARDDHEYAARARIAIACARYARRPELLKQSLESIVFSSTWPLTVNLAMVLSALHAAGLRGRPVDPGVLDHLLQLTLEKVPDDLRLEALVVFRSMFGRDQHLQPAAASYAQIKKRYANLSAESKAIRLFQWATMDWWVADIGKFAGHQQPVRIRAIDGLLAVLNPRLQSQSESCKHDCLVALLSRILPHEGEGEQLEHWDACIEAWSESAASLPAPTLALMLCNVTRPNLKHDDKLWLIQFAVLIKALAACVARIGDDAGKRKALLGSLDYWFACNVPAVLKLQAPYPQLALTICILTVPLLRQLGTPFAARLELDLRNAVNPKNKNANSADITTPSLPKLAQASTG